MTGGEDRSPFATSSLIWMTFSPGATGAKTSISFSPSGWSALDHYHRIRAARQHPAGVDFNRLPPFHFDSGHRAIATAPTQVR